MRDDMQREVIEQLDKALNVGETKTGEATYNTSTHIPVVLYDFHLSVDKLLSLQEGMTDPASDFEKLSDRDKADGYISAKVVESVLSKADSQLKEDYASMADIVGPSKLDVGELCGVALEYYGGKNHSPSENLYLSDRTPERLEMFFDNYGDTGNDNFGCPDYAHCWLSDENDHRDMDNLEVGNDRHGMERGGMSGVAVRNIGPDAESFLTSISQADKIKMLEDYRNGSGELNVAKEESIRVDAWLSEVYKSAAEEMLSKEDASADDIKTAGDWLLTSESLSSEDLREEIDSAYAKAAEAFAKEGRFEDAYEVSRAAGGKVSQETKLSYIDQAIYLTAREYLQDHVQNNGDLIDAIETKGEGYTEVVRDGIGNLDEGYSLDESVNGKLVYLLDARDKVAAGNEDLVEKPTVSESSVEKPETKDSPESQISNDAETAVSEPEEPSAVPDTDAAPPPETPPEVETNTFDPSAITPEFVEKAAGSFISLLKDQSTETHIRERLGDETADRYKDLLVDLSTATAAGDKEKINECCSELVDILNKYQRNEVDTGLFANESAQARSASVDAGTGGPVVDTNNRDGLIKEEFFRLGKLANVDLNTNRRIPLRSNNPYQLMATVDFLKYIRGMDKDTFHRVTDQEKPSAIKTEAAIAVTTINCLRAFTISNFASVYSEAIYQAFLKEANNNDQEKKENNLVDKAGVSYVLRYYTKDVSNLVSRPESDLSKQLQKEIGQEKYEKFKELLENYEKTGEKSYLKEATRLIQREDSAIGGRGMNERYDRRDFVQNYDIFRNAVDAWRDGREITLTITGRGSEKGKVTTGYVLLSFLNLAINSDVGYTLEKKLIEGFQELFFSAFDAKHESVGDMIGRVSGVVEKHQDGWVELLSRPHVDINGNEDGKIALDRYRNNEDGTSDKEQRIEYNNGNKEHITSTVDPKNRTEDETRSITYSEGRETRMETAYKLDANGNRMKDADGHDVKDTEKGTYRDGNGNVHDVDLVYRLNGRAEGTNQFIEKGIEYKNEISEARDVRSAKYQAGVETRMETAYKLDAAGNRMKDAAGHDIKDTEKGTFRDSKGVVHDVDYVYRDGHREGTDKYTDKGVETKIERSEARDVVNRKYSESVETRMETTYKLDANGNRLKDADGHDIKETEKGTFRDDHGIIHDVDRVYRDGHMEGTDHFIDKRGVEYLVERTESRDVVHRKYPDGVETRMETTYKLDADGNRMKDADGRDIKDTEKGTFRDDRGIVHDVDYIYRDGHREGTDKYTEKGVENKVERSEACDVVQRKYPNGIEIRMETTYKLDADGSRMKDVDGHDIKDTEKGTFRDSKGIVHDVDYVYRDGHREGTDKFTDNGIENKIERSEVRDVVHRKYPDSVETRMETTYKLDADGSRMKDAAGHDVKDTEKGTYRDGRGIVHDVDLTYRLDGRAEGTDRFIENNIEYKNDHAEARDILSTKYPDGVETRMETTYKLDADGNRMKDADGHDIKDTEKGTYRDGSGTVHEVDFVYRDGRREGSERYTDNNGVEYDNEHTEAKDTSRVNYPDGQKTQMEITYKLDADGNRMKDADGHDIKHTEIGSYIDSDGVERPVDLLYDDSGKLVELPGGDPFDAESMATLESIDDESEEIYHTAAIDGAYELDQMAPEDRPDEAPETYLNAAHDLAEKDKPTGDELRQAAIWVEKAMPDNPGESRALHAKACEAYLDAGNAYGAYKESVAAKDEVSPDVKEKSISAYASASVEWAKSDAGSYVRAARLFDMLPAERQSSPEAMLSYEKAADAMSRNVNASRADLMKGVEWGSRIKGYDHLKIELMETRAKDMTNNYDIFVKEQLQPEIQHAIMEGKQVDLKALYEKVCAEVEPYYPAKATVQENGEARKYTMDKFINDVKICIEDMREANSKDDTTIENASDRIDMLEEEVSKYDSDKIEISESEVEKKEGA